MIAAILGIAGSIGLIIAYVAIVSAGYNNKVILVGIILGLISIGSITASACLVNEARQSKYVAFTEACKSAGGDYTEEIFSDGVFQCWNTTTGQRVFPNV